MCCAASAILSSGSTFGMGVNALVFTGAAGLTGTIGTHTSGLGPRNSGDSIAGLKFLK